MSLNLRQYTTASTPRLPDETDDELRIRVKTHQAKRYSITCLKRFLYKLGIKSAKTTGLNITFAGINTHVPGVYSNVKTI